MVEPSCLRFFSRVLLIEMMRSAINFTSANLPVVAAFKSTSDAETEGNKKVAETHMAVTVQCNASNTAINPFDTQLLTAQPTTTTATQCKPPSSHHNPPLLLETRFWEDGLDNAGSMQGRVGVHGTDEDFYLRHNNPFIIISSFHTTTKINLSQNNPHQSKKIATT